ncbi:hypothetical protein BH24PSE2_BH24PSE2_09130 [soil metagenome]
MHMKKQLVIALGLSLAGGAAIAGNEGEYSDSTEMDPMETQTPEVTSEMDTMETESPEMTSEMGTDPSDLSPEAGIETSTAMNFEDLDVNQDSLISEQEATDSQVLDSEAFANADTNQDGYLSQTEYDAHGSASGMTDLGVESETELELDDAS